MPTIVIAEFFNCARCREAHRGLEFFPFTQNPIVADGLTYTHFTDCPTLHEPILLAQVEIEKEPHAASEEENLPLPSLVPSGA